MRISDWSSDVCSSDLHQRIADQLQLAAPVVKAGLVDGNAFVAQRLVDFDCLVERLDRGRIDYLDIAFETAGHAGGIILDVQTLEPQDERQRLNQPAITDSDYAITALPPFGPQHLSAKTTVP